jgi:hypothetical protein
MWIAAPLLWIYRNNVTRIPVPRADVGTAVLDALLFC